MALFFLVVDLAFPPGRFDAAVKLGLLLASVLAGAGGALVLLTGGSEWRARRP
jgi:Na+/H+ antiporter NhaA